jgi:hypothetical protein
MKMRTQHYAENFCCESTGRLRHSAEKPTRLASDVVMQYTIISYFGILNIINYSTTIRSWVSTGIFLPR